MHEINELEEEEEDDTKRYIDRIIKTNREIFIMLHLLDKQMCGYDVIKEIFLKCNIFLSQGTIYPILYSMEEEGILQVEYSKGDMRSKNYSLTPKGKKIAQKDIEDFINAMDHLISMIKREIK
jgi:PadR family transcriptional regulator, regulatory protein PadR